MKLLSNPSVMSHNKCFLGEKIPQWIADWCNHYGKTVLNFLRKLKMDLPFDLAIPLLGSYPKNPETPIQKNLCTPIFIAGQFTLAKCWKQPRCPSVNE